MTTPPPPSYRPTVGTPPRGTGGTFPPPRQQRQAPRSAPKAGANGAQTKNEFNSKSFAPGITFNVTTGSHNSNGGGQGRSGGRHTESLLPPPEFSSPAQVRDYCNSIRAAAVSLSIEVAMGAEILKGILATVPDPEGRIGASRMRAARVSRKLARSADALRDAAKNAAATYAMFQREYEEEIGRVRHRARRPQGPRMDWAQQ
ncbi:plasmid transfer protein TraA [Streptomyces goshikiensis]|uniref:plasmid transfer protein TraA n=1 Tax=Streptomyces goshikiensis TaxID=1942 RepID=UPI0022F3AF0D|nr:plasmid transfer protein TraA [Streptomyces goshikiensis]WBY20033.1 plasmid transfer protein TraA [Streptomyces goshikiensis]